MPLRQLEAMGLRLSSLPRHPQVSSPWPPVTAGHLGHGRSSTPVTCPLSVGTLTWPSGGWVADEEVPTVCGLDQME